MVINITVKQVNAKKQDVFMPQANAAEDGITAGGALNYDGRGTKAEFSVTVKLRLIITPQCKVDLKVTAEEKFNASASLRDFLKSFNADGVHVSEELAKVDLPNVQFMVGYVPVVLTNEVSLTGDLNMASSFNPSISIKQSQTIGFGYTTKKGFYTIREGAAPVSELSFNGLDQKNADEYTIFSAQADFTLTLGFESKLYDQMGLEGSVGGKISAGGQVQLADDAQKNDAIELPGIKKAFVGSVDINATVPLHVGIAVGDDIRQVAKNIFDNKVFEVSLPTYDKEFPIALYNKQFGEVRTGFRDFAGEYAFSSGAGTWATMMTLNSDGTFSGDFHDSDMGATGHGYPNGMRSESIFTGKFSNLRKIDENTFVATVASLNVSDTIGRQYVEYGVLITITEVYGMKQGRTAVFARQGRTASDIGEEAKIWIYSITGQELGTTLPRTSIFIRDNHSDTLSKGYVFVDNSSGY
ncbi:hypothetical protein CYJ33_03200 [Alloscardovia omnicolens]|uniref:hypothetical protein n=1 Tax=Alloscardovia omnicolens TaxID=419015 RepID=UPI000763CFE5|nr:hypothetical protein [Alloscardovia omnicolens]KWZ75924.1 hypothetical protein HMPREF3214_00118 [Alloscardovia omnicolens]PKY78651.1 hypothetical protein CYJ33_03200 [Alloscardovia omnicolens]